MINERNSCHRKRQRFPHRELQTGKRAVYMYVCTYSMYREYTQYPVMKCYTPLIKRYIQIYMMENIANNTETTYVDMHVYVRITQ